MLAVLVSFSGECKTHTHTTTQTHSHNHTSTHTFQSRTGFVSSACEYKQIHTNAHACMQAHTPTHLTGLDPWPSPSSNGKVSFTGMFILWNWGMFEYIQSNVSLQREAWMDYSIFCNGLQTFPLHGFSARVHRIHERRNNFTLGFTFSVGAHCILCGRTDQDSTTVQDLKLGTSPAYGTCDYITV